MSQDQTSSGTNTAKPTTAGDGEQATTEATGAAASETTVSTGDAGNTPDATPETGGSYLAEPSPAQQKVAEGLRAAGEKLGALAPDDGVAKDLADKASTGLKQAGEWVSERDAGAMVTEAKSFARRKPWAVALGALAGVFVLSRFTRKKH